MSYTAADLDMADRHVAQGEGHVTRQRELVRRLHDQGHPTDAAENLLAEFEAVLLEHVRHRDQIAADLRRR
jgi:hypothetical protein